MASISCDFVRDRLFDYLEGECDEAQRIKIEEHLNECDECRKEAEMRRQLLKLLGDSAYYPKSGLAAAFLGAAAIEAPKKRFNMRKLVRYGGIAVAAVIVVTVALNSGILNLIRGGADSATEAAFDTAGNSKSMDYATAETYAETTAAVAAYGASTESYSDEDVEGGGQIIYSINSVPTAIEEAEVEEEAPEAPKKNMVLGATADAVLPLEQQRVKDHSPLFDSVQSFYTAGAFVELDVEIVVIEGLETHFGDGYTLHIIERSEASIDAVQELLREVGYEMSTRVVDAEIEYIALIIPTA